MMILNAKYAPRRRTGRLTLPFRGSGSRPGAEFPPHSSTKRGVAMAKLITTADGRVIFDESTVIEWDPDDGECPMCQRMECGGIRTCASILEEHSAWLKAKDLYPDNDQWHRECMDIANILALAFDARIDAGTQRAAAKIRIIRGE